jgi:hypothetical protein
MMERLKAMWTVEAGVLPGHPEKEHAKVWYYTSAHYEQDAKMPADTTETSIFQTMMLEAKDYWLQMNNPQYLNFADLKFMWM